MVCVILDVQLVMEQDVNWLWEKNCVVIVRELVVMLNQICGLNLVIDVMVEVEYLTVEEIRDMFVEHVMVLAWLVTKRA